MNRWAQNRNITEERRASAELFKPGIRESQGKPQREEGEGDKKPTVPVSVCFLTVYSHVKISTG